MTGPRDPKWWTPERRQAMRDWWTAERRLQQALRRKARPQGSRSKEWWTAERRAEHSRKALQRGRRSDLQTVEDAFDMADRVREQWRNRPW